MPPFPMIQYPLQYSLISPLSALSRGTLFPLMQIVPLIHLRLRLKAVRPTAMRPNATVPAPISLNSTLQ
jgi:hypothetical protein